MPFGGVMRFRLRKESRSRAAVNATLTWFKNTKLGWNWLFIVLAFQIVSAWTNVLGLELAMPLSAALLTGIGIQLMLMYCGVRQMNSHEEDRDQWKAPIATLVALSAFFSFVGFTRFYAEYRERSDLPVRLREDLKSQGTMLATAADEARMVALQALTNRIDYAQGQIAVINRKHEAGMYSNDIYPAGEIARHEQAMDEAMRSRSKWETLKVDVTRAIANPDPMKGFAMLKSDHDHLAQLMGSIRGQERGNFQMPPPPVPDKLNGDQVKQDPIKATTAQIFSVAGLFWLVLSLLIEAAPFMIAKANGARPAGPVRDEEPPVDPALQHGHYWRVQPRGEHDAAMASDITKLHELITCGAQAGAFDLTQQLDQEERLEPIRKDVQVAGARFVENAQLELSAAAEIARAKKFFAQMAEISPDVKQFEDQIIRQIVQKHAIACGYFIEMPAETKQAPRVVESWSEA
jgi:hypothetical protein